MPPAAKPPFPPAENASISLEDANSIVLILDAKGRVHFLNRFGLEFFGYQRSEIFGQPIVGTLVPEKDRSGSDLAAMIDDLLHRPDDYVRQINENRRKSGQRVWVVWSNRAFRDENGNVSGLLCVGNDITDRKAFESFLEQDRVKLTARVQEQNLHLKEANEKLKAEIAQREKVQQELQESRNRYRQLSEASTEGILFHENGMIIEVNDAFAELVECPHQQLIGMDVIENFIAFEDQERVRDRVDSDDERPYEVTGRTITGRKFPVELRARACEVAGRRCRVVTVRDITHRKKTERKLIQSQKMEAVGTLASGIAHDFNNMLAGIQGNVEILRRQLTDENPQRKRMDIICQIVERGAKLTGQLLGYARGGQEEVREIDLNRLVEGTLEMFGRAQRHIVIETRMDPDIPTVKGDSTQIEQVLLNLMINAVHAMPEGGKLFIETAATRLSKNESRVYEIVPGRYAMLSVRDTGKGMDRGTQKQIFEPFFTTKERGEGTGLGLASTYGIVKAHKGYIEVYSEPDEGSQFNVLLPASDSKASVETAAEPVVETGTEPLMIVDDEPEFLDVGREMLELLGYTVIAAGSIEEALERFSSDPGSVRLVILDMIMPGPPVSETIRRLRDIDGTVPVLLASGYSQDAEAVRQSLKICNGFIQKPFRMVSLSRKIRAIFEDAQDENR